MYVYVQASSAVSVKTVVITRGVNGEERIQRPADRQDAATEKRLGITVTAERDGRIVTETANPPPPTQTNQDVRARASRHRAHGPARRLAERNSA